MLAASHLTTNVDNNNNTSVDTASITPTANALVLFFVRQHRSDGGNPTAPTLSGNGLTWVQATTRRLTTDASHRVTLFRAMGTPSAGAVTISFSENTNEKSWTVVEFTGVDTSGTNGSGAVVQTADNDSTSPLTVTLGAFTNASNATFGAMSTNGANAITVGSGFTQLGNTALSGSVQSQYKTTNDTTVDWTFAGGSWGAGIATEIKAASIGFFRLM